MLIPSDRSDCFRAAAQSEPPVTTLRHLSGQPPVPARAPRDYKSVPADCSQSRTAALPYPTARMMVCRETPSTRATAAVLSPAPTSARAWAFPSSSRAAGRPPFLP